MLTGTLFPKIKAMRTAPKVMIAVLLHWPMMSDVEAGGMVVETEAAEQISFSVDHLQGRRLASL